MLPRHYLGYERTENFSSPGGAVSGEPRDYAAPAHHWALSGNWAMGKESVVFSLFLPPQGRERSDVELSRLTEPARMVQVCPLPRLSFQIFFEACHKVAPRPVIAGVSWPTSVAVIGGTH